MKTDDQESAAAPLDLAALRTQLSGLRGERYWRSLEELADNETFHELLAARISPANFRLDRPVGTAGILKTHGRFARPGGAHRLRQIGGDQRKNRSLC